MAAALEEKVRANPLDPCMDVLARICPFIAEELAAEKLPRVYISVLMVLSKVVLFERVIEPVWGEGMMIERL